MIDGSEEHKLKFLGSCDIVRHCDSQLGPLCKKKNILYGMIFFHPLYRSRMLQPVQICDLLKGNIFYSIPFV